MVYFQHKWHISSVFSFLEFALSPKKILSICSALFPDKLHMNQSLKSFDDPLNFYDLEVPMEWNGLLGPTIEKLERNMFVGVR